MMFHSHDYGMSLLWLIHRCTHHLTSLRSARHASKFCIYKDYLEATRLLCPSLRCA